VAVRVSSANGFGTAVACTAVSKALEAVCTVAAHTFIVGDYVLVSAEEGMYQLDNVVAKVKAQTATSVTLQGIDSTSFDDAISGKTTLRKITFGINMTTAQAVQSGGGGFEFVDTTTIHDGGKTQVPGDANAATFTFSCFWNPTDTALAALRTASVAQEQRAIFMQFGVGGPIMVFIGYVGATLLPAGQARQLVTTDVAVTVFGTPTYY
jgi:hypothetical protein